MTETSLQKLEKEVTGFPDRARLIIVHDEKTLLGANGFLVAVKKMRKEINDTFDPIIQKAHQTHKEAVMQKKKYEEPLKKAEDMIKLQIAGYMTEQERIRKEIEERLAREEAERKKIEEEKLKEAEALEEEGFIEEAEKALEEIPLPSTYIPPEKLKLNGTAIRKDWKWRVININQVPREYLIIDSSKITQLVKSTKGQARIPGIEIYSESNVTVRIGQ